MVVLAVVVVLWSGVRGNVNVAGDDDDTWWGLRGSVGEATSLSESMFSGGMVGLDFRKKAIFSLQRGIKLITITLEIKKIF